MKLISGLLGLFAIALAAAAASDDAVHHSALHDYRVVPVVQGLVRPWAIAFLPDGTMLVTEKPGRLRVVRDGELQREPVANVPPVHDVGQGGLLDVAVHPAFEGNRWIYLSFAKPLGGGESTTAVVRGRLVDDRRLTDVEEIFVAETRGRGHYGSRLAFDGKGHLFVTVGERMAPPRGDLEAHPAQDLANHHGVLVRINEDGSVPLDNPYVGRADAKAEIWSYGHRNAQGLVVHPTTGELWLTEHGPQGGDELNRIVEGANYGWPVIGYGVNYRSGSAIHGGTHRDGMEQPVKVWVPSIGVSGLAVYQGDAFPHWQGSFLAGGLSGKRITLIHFRDGDFREETLIQGLGRVRDVRVGPDGLIYVAIDDTDGAPTPIVRLEPVRRREIAAP